MRRSLLATVLAVSACTGGAAPVSAPAPTPVVTSEAPRATPAASPTPRPRVSSRPFHWSVRRVTAADVTHSWRAGCPVGPSQLRLVTLDFRDFSGVPRTGRLVVNEQVVGDVAAVFRTLYLAGFPVRSLRPVDDYGGSDDRSMAADNSSGFNCRDAVGGSGWSMHAYGLAVDVNPRENPYLYGGKVLPPEGAAFTDRAARRPGMAFRSSALNRAFAAAGWSWGGRWSSPDYQHFDRPPKAVAVARVVIRRTAAVSVASCPRVPAVKANQVVLVVGGGSSAVVRACERRAGVWVSVLGRMLGHVGLRGVAPVGAKREGDDRTPGGVFGLGRGFGVRSDPGVVFGWRRTDRADVWVDDSGSRAYNTWQRTPANGRWRSAEDLYVPGPYDYAQVVDYNTARVAGRGSAIFLHVDHESGTHGCISVPRSQLLSIFRWERAGAVIVIG